MKTCSRCKEEKELSEFYKHIRSKDGLCAYCKECDKKAKKDYYSRNKEETIARVKAWSEANPDKVRINKRNWKRKNPDSNRRYKLKRYQLEKIGHFTEEEWIELCNYYGNVCLRCGSNEKLTADHVKPLFHGGGNSIDNIQPLCLSCNSGKGAKEIDYRYEI